MQVFVGQRVKTPHGFGTITMTSRDQTGILKVLVTIEDAAYKREGWYSENQLQPASPTLRIVR